MMKIIEGIQMWLGHIAENLAEAVSAVTAQAEAQEDVVRKVDQLEEAVRALTGKVGQLCDSVKDLDTRLGTYLADEAKKDVTVRSLQRDHLALVSEVREIRKGASGG